MKLVANIISFLLVLTLLFNSLQLSITYAYYYLDKADFIDMLCVNKDKPEMHCDGKCHLKKMAQENSGTKDKVPFKEFNLKEILLFVVQQPSCQFINPSLKKSFTGYYNNLYAYNGLCDLDHPPQISSHFLFKI